MRRRAAIVLLFAAAPGCVALRRRRGRRARRPGFRPDRARPLSRDGRPIAPPATPCRTAASRSPAAAPIETPFGNIVAPNITPDRETGIGAWTDDEFDAALRKGIRPRRRAAVSGDALSPTYTKMTRDDVLAIRAYLDDGASRCTIRSMRESAAVPVQHPRRACGPGTRCISRRASSSPTRASRAEWNRGAYLVEGPGPLRRLPHAEESFLGGDKTERVSAGLNSARLVRARHHQR